MSTACFVSDLHLFARRSTAAAHHELLLEHARRCDRVILGGDIFDFRWSTLANRRATADAAIGWLERLLDDLPTQEVHYLLGNHDHVQPMLDALPPLCRTQTRLQWHEYFLRLGETVFLHGDVADRPMNQHRIEQRRLRSLHHGRRRRGRISNAAYQAMLQTRVQHAVPRVVYPRRVAAGRILRYLETIGQRNGVREIFFGHTHRPVDGYELDGVTFHNAGAPIGDQPLCILQTTVDDTHVVAA